MSSRSRQETVIALRNLEQYAEKLSTKFSDAVIGTALNIHGKIVDKSPVDTGNYKINNRIAINDAPTDVIEDPNIKQFEELDTEERESIQFQISNTAADQAIELAKKQANKNIPIKRVILFNNVEYAIKLEEGRSKQAPLGIYSVSVLNTEHELEKEMKKLGLL